LCDGCVVSGLRVCWFLIFSWLCGEPLKKQIGYFPLFPVVCCRGVAGVAWSVLGFGCRKFGFVRSVGFGGTVAEWCAENWFGLGSFFLIRVKNSCFVVNNLFQLALCVSFAYW
jgi:hypothetical protein